MKLGSRGRSIGKCSARSRFIGEDDEEVEDEDTEDDDDEDDNQLSFDDLDLDIYDEE